MHRAPYGSWPSPIDAALVAAGDGAPEFLGAVGEELWWTAPRPEAAATTADGVLGGVRTLAGGTDEAIAQAEWAPDGTLLAVTDRTGWWNLHRLDPATGEATALCPRPGGVPRPPW